jgi:ABC-type amino acid transport substrate-binding protein
MPEMLRKLAVPSLLFALAWIGIQPVRADALKVAIPEIAPFGFYDAEKKPAGLYVELTELVARKAGVPIALTIIPLPRAYAGLADGTYDALTVIASSKSDELGTKVAQMADIDTIVIGAKGTSFADVASLKGKSFANLRGMIYDPRFNGDDDIKKVDSSSYEMNINLLAAGRVDGMIGPAAGLLWNIKKAGRSAADFGTPLVLNTNSLYLYYSIKSMNPEIAAKLGEAAAALKAEKAFDGIVAKYTR